MRDIKIRPLVLSALLSLFLHGVLAALLMPSFYDVSPQEPVSFEVAWVKSSPPCHPRESGDPGDFPQKTPIVVKTASPSLKKAQSPSSKFLDPRLRGDDKRGNGNDIRGHEGDKKGVPDDKSAHHGKASQEPTQPKDLTHPYAGKDAMEHHPRHPLPSYPWVCRKRGQEGVVCLHVKTNKEGQVVEAHLHKSSGHDLLDKAALEAVKSWVLSEGNSDKTLSIAFRLEGENVSFS